ncbi:hypothetical protein GGU11DRAFT_757481 [Lentinula aff. detonsa]|nr:hypothetical protein GGU11DRAFT_757481 [Lentinula aff. detonsa]
MALDQKKRALAKRRLPAGEDKCLLATTPTVKRKTQDCQCCFMQYVFIGSGLWLPFETLFLQKRSLLHFHFTLWRIRSFWTYYYIVGDVWMPFKFEVNDYRMRALTMGFYYNMEGSVIMSTALNAYHTPPRIDSSR